MNQLGLLQGRFVVKTMTSIKLYDDKIISEFDFNRYMVDYNLRKQELDAAENNLDLIKEGASKKSGSVSNLVRSTADGMILDVPVKQGTFVIESNTFNLLYATNRFVY